MNITSLLLVAALSGPAFVPGSVDAIYPDVIVFTVRWEGHGEQKVVAGCKSHQWALGSEGVIRDAEEYSPMFDIINSACKEQWL